MKYLFLSKLFFVLLSKVAIGVNLTDRQYVFIEKFCPFFDGVNVLSDDYCDDNDDSVLGMFKEVGSEFASVFVSGNTVFSFDEFINEFEERTDKFAIPDFESSIDSFKRAYSQSQLQEDSSPKETTNVRATTILCTNCNATIDANMKFCPECGASLVPKREFCSECGNKCDPGMKFCPFCGNKM